MSELDSACIKHFLSFKRGKTLCPFCGHDGFYVISENGKFKCRLCQRKYSWTADTFLQGTKLPASALYKIAFMVSLGIGPKTVQRDLNISWKSAWLIVQKFKAHPWFVWMMANAKIDVSAVMVQKKTKSISERKLYSRKWGQLMERDNDDR